MADITLCVLLTPKTHTPDSGVVWKPGEIVNVYPTASKNWDSVNASSPLGYIHIAGVPAGAIDRAKRKLRQGLYLGVEDDGTVDTRGLTRLARSRFRINPADVPAGFRTALLRDRQITVTWAQAKPYLIDAYLNRAIEDEDLA